MDYKGFCLEYVDTIGSNLPPKKVALRLGLAVRG